MVPIILYEDQNFLIPYFSVSYFLFREAALPKAGESAAHFHSVCVKLFPKFTPSLVKILPFQHLSPNYHYETILLRQYCCGCTHHL